MSNIIVTVTTNFYPESLDMELPDDVLVSKLTVDIAECLTYQLMLNINPADLAIICSRTDSILQPDQTLSDAGVWNGDYISVVSL